MNQKRKPSEILLQKINKDFKDWSAYATYLPPIRKKKFLVVAALYQDLIDAHQETLEVRDREEKLRKWLEANKPGIDTLKDELKNNFSTALRDSVNVQVEAYNVKLKKYNTIFDSIKLFNYNDAYQAYWDKSFAFLGNDLYLKHFQTKVKI